MASGNPGAVHIELVDPDAIRYHFQGEETAAITSLLARFTPRLA